MMDDAKKLTAWGMDDGVHDALSLKAYRTKCVSTLGASAQVDAPFSAV